MPGEITLSVWGAVSYTHLDVYKRQAQGVELLAPAGTPDALRAAVAAGADAVYVGLGAFLSLIHI